MKTPVPPPPTADLFRSAAGDRLVELLRDSGPLAMQGEYLSWDKLRHLAPPENWTHEEWWLALKLARHTVRRELQLLRDKSGDPFHYTLPDALLSAIDAVTRRASGNIIAVSEQVTNPSVRDRYIVSSLIEEAITSSQLEGAATSRRVAKEMIRSGRPPVDISERMILNNFRAMQEIVTLRHEALTPELICRIHRLVTDGTLDNPQSAGQIQTDQDDRISVWGDGEQLLHRPPPVEELAERMMRLCEFANAGSVDAYVPPLLRAVTIHFMMGFDHYFEDGNGRTARAIFYWSMLREGFWLTEFLTISHILKKAPAQYARSFLLTEQDEGDLTHFFLFQVDVVMRAIDNLHKYLADKARELSEVQIRISARPGEYNNRQLAVLESAIKNPAATYTAKSHGRSQNVSTVTARHDLAGLEGKGLLASGVVSRQRVWTPHPDLAALLRR